MYRCNVDLSQITWFRCGGIADLVYRPNTLDDIIQCLHKHYDTSIQILGACSNVLIRDGGIKSPIIRLGKGFNYCNIISDYTVEIGASTLDSSVAQFCTEHMIGGMEFLATIPGTIGGNIKMNAGCHGRSISDILISCKAIDHNGIIHTFHRDQINFKYRYNPLPNDLIYISGVFQL